MAHARRGYSHTQNEYGGRLFTRTQQRVLGFVFGQLNRDLGTVELINLAGSGSGAVQRELQRLAASGLFVTSVIRVVREIEKRVTALDFASLH